MPRQAPPAPGDILCESCGYLLSGLSPDSNCPECGTSARSSTTDSPRAPTPWESRRAYFRTLLQWTFAPVRAARSISLASHGRDTSFARLTLLLAALVAMPGVLVHFDIVTTGIFGWGSRAWTDEAQLARLGIAVGVPLVFIVLLGPALLRLTAYLSALEGAYWGYRLPRPRALRVLRYLTAQLVPAVAIGSLLVGSYALLQAGDLLPPHPPTWYLYGLCGYVVLASLLLFRNYVRCMFAVVHANDPEAIGVWVESAPGEPLARATGV